MIKHNIYLPGLFGIRYQVSRQAFGPVIYETLYQTQGSGVTGYEKQNEETDMPYSYGFDAGA